MQMDKNKRGLSVQFSRDNFPSNFKLLINNLMFIYKDLLIFNNGCWSLCKGSNNSKGTGIHWGSRDYHWPNLIRLLTEIDH